VQQEHARADLIATGYFTICNEYDWFSPIKGDACTHLCTSEKTMDAEGLLYITILLANFTQYVHNVLF